ncbi:GNAT family N-acetyltransferase [Kosmotoga olearia]|uniref:GCN5-related N-acetyltransferase n=1 Tax=Kosmotoga olearia (strain ATCC BAA-1733 / DSM 21960 / TBF 19.5.1) TaxID=521045 RepID=C5CJ28_KOSOT|nr:GNAT family N-acetyltransferase [Kosmotoga olearia]ACR79944.1 GCN5-related N-acetyltransferase [Kosmotoga olearia TBF 19.5.1]
MNITLMTFPGSDKERLAEAFEIRREVFIEGQGIAEAIEIDGLDPEAVHFLIKCDGKAVGTCRVREVENGIWKLERFSIRKPYRGMKLGTRLLEFVESQARNKGIYRIIMNAQLSASGFYLKAGYIKDSEEFEEAGIIHIKMYKDLTI